MNQEPVTSLKGIGEKTAGLFARLGVHTVEDLLHDYPRAYDAYEEPVPVGRLQENTTAAVAGQLLKTASVRRFKNVQVIVVTIKDMTGSLQLTWYNMPYLRNTLQMGQFLVFRGRVVKKGGRLTMEQPEIFTPEAYEAVRDSMQPIYGQTKGLGNKAIVRAVAQALEQRQMEREYLPSSLREKYELAEYNYAIEHIHFPSSRQELLFARKRLVFDEFFFFLLAVRRLKEKRQDCRSSFVMSHAPQVDRLREALPYSLTEAQNQVLKEVSRDLESGLVMNRLIQGDVGSGKTIIAVLALLQTACNGFQGALMAPTEVLAKQHFESITGLFKTYGIEKTAVLVTGSMTAKEKRLAYEKIASHEADIIVGTHALIQEKVQYDKLALVITDEQHRFGVRQRECLANKGEGVHVLVMSATPIPRTLAIVLYGDLEVSVLDEMPKNRLPIKNCVVDPSFRKKAYAFLEAQVEAGHQVYVICPMVEAGEDSADGLENVTDYTEKLKAALNSSIRVAALHGKMKAAQKQEIMDAFGAGQIDVLVSTTVIEVGINVPNATVMLVENAERFGLAQLHQLRGRVGRGHAQSFCIFMTGDGSGAKNKRLDVLNHSNDGFFIANEDLKLRGPGDLFGIRQSGDLDFGLGDIYQDSDVLMLAGELADQVLSGDVVLPEKEFGLFEKSIDYRTI